MPAAAGVITIETEEPRRIQRLGLFFLADHPVRCGHVVATVAAVAIRVRMETDMKPAMPDAQVAAPFNAVPAEWRVRAFGVDYVRKPRPDGSELYLTRYGWPFAEALDPDVWYHGGQMVPFWQTLAGGTGSVYRATVFSPLRSFDIVVKFSRFAQDVPLFLDPTNETGVEQVRIDNARFNSPFEEFGLLCDIRAGGMAPHLPPIRTKRPLAIYCPATRYPLWQLGRTPTRFAPYQQALARDQEHVPEDRAIQLHLTRDYLLVFAYVPGINAEDLYTQGQLSREELLRLSRRVTSELTARGFHVLDNKPKHFILRPRRQGGLLRRRSQLVYALVDFELMQRTAEYERAVLGTV